jgi:hypothetical protein
MKLQSSPPATETSGADSRPSPQQPPDLVTGGITAMTLEGIRWRNRLSGEETKKPIQYLFLFIGAEPATGCLQRCVSLESKVFVQTGASARHNGAAPLSLQSSLPGVFAVGDVRSGRTRRCCGWRRSRSSGPTTYLSRRHTQAGRRSRPIGGRPAHGIAAPTCTSASP